MFIKGTKKSATIIALVLILTNITLVSCSSDGSQNPPSSSEQQSSNLSGQQSTDQPKQQDQPSPTGQLQPPTAPNMTEVLNRAAEILDISPDEFIAAFQNAMPSAPPGQQQGKPPEHPEGQEGQPPPASRADQQMFQSEMMTEVYEAMAVELNVSADDIAEAITQAETELGK